MMNYKKTNKSKPRGRPQVSTLKRFTKSVTVKFSKPDHEKLRHRSKNANRTLERASSKGTGIQSQVYQGQTAAKG